MRRGDIVRWTEIEQAFHIACGPGTFDLTSVRRCGIITDTNPWTVFVRWENGDFVAQKRNTVEVISASR